MAKDEVRIDKFMWATRIFKTRTIATEACKKGRVMLDGVAVKPSRMIKVGDVIQVRKPACNIFFSSSGSLRKSYGGKISSRVFGEYHSAGTIRIARNGAYRRFCQSPKRIGTTDEKRRSSNEAIPRIGVCR